MTNTPEDCVAALRFTLSSLYGTLLELLVDSMGPDKSELHEKAAARAMAHPKTASGLIGKLYALVGQLEREVEACRQGLMGDVDEDILRLLQSVPQVFPDVGEEESPAETEEELSDADDGVDGWDLTDFRWVSPLPFDETQTNLRARRASGTCEWLLSHEDFGTWAASDVSATFFLTGSCKYQHLSEQPVVF